MGTLGAVDPYLVKQITIQKEQADITEVSEIFNSMP
jgi:hypothetical protein